MLDLTMGGVCMSGLDAVEFLEMLPDNISDEVKDDDFCEEYERMLNRVRFEVRRSVPVPPKVTRATSRGYGDFYSCGQCGRDVDVHKKYCDRCGRAIGWDESSR